MTRLFIALLIALLAPALLTAAVPRTIIVGSLNLPSGGNPGTTVITLTPSTNFAVSDGTTKYNVVAPVTYSVSNSAALFMYVVPNTGSSNVPDYTTYTAQIKSNDKIVSTQTWQVGTNALPVQVADVIVSTSTTVTPTAALPLVGGTMLGKITLGSTSSLSGLRWPTTAAPSSAAEGDTYISSSDGKLYIFFGGIWTAPTGITSVQHYSDLTGNGTAASPLRITPGAAGSVMLTVTGGNTVTATTITGDVTFSASGVTAIGALKVLGGMIASLPNTITNVTAATALTIAATGTEIILQDALRLVSIASNPASVGGEVYHSTQKAFTDTADIGALTRPGTYSVQVADSSAIANTTAETAFDQLPTAFPTDTLTAGRVIRWRAKYLVSTTGSPTFRLRYQLHGTNTETFADPGSGWAAGNGVTNKTIIVSGELTIRNIASPAAATYDANALLMHAGGGVSPFNLTGPTDQFGSPDATVRVNQAKTLRDLWTWSAASASNTVKRVSLVVEVVR